MVAVKIALDWTPNTNHVGFYLAQQQQLFAKAGLEVTIISPHTGEREPGRQRAPPSCAGPPLAACGCSRHAALVCPVQHAATPSGWPGRPELTHSVPMLCVPFTCITYLHARPTLCR